MSSFWQALFAKRSLIRKDHAENRRADETYPMRNMSRLQTSGDVPSAPLTSRMLSRYACLRQYP